MLLLLSLLTPISEITLDSDALISAEIQGFATSSGLSKGVILLLPLWAAAVSLCAFVADDSALAISVEHLMVLVLPLFTRVLAILIDVLSGILTRSYFLKIQIPNANDKVAKVLITLETLVQIMMVLHELLSANGLVACEPLFRVVEGAEHFKESETRLFDRLESSFHIGVARWIEVVFYFIKFESSALIDIQFVESKIDNASPVLGEFTTKSR